jgi:hypothetical protein
MSIRCGRSLPFRLHNQNFVRISHTPILCYMPCPSYRPWFGHRNDIWRSLQIQELLVMQFFRSRRFIPLRLKYFPRKTPKCWASKQVERITITCRWTKRHVKVPLAPVQRNIVNYACYVQIITTLMFHDHIPMIVLTVISFWEGVYSKKAPLKHTYIRTWPAFRVLCIVP